MPGFEPATPFSEQGATHRMGLGFIEVNPPLDQPWRL